MRLIKVGEFELNCYEDAPDEDVVTEPRLKKLSKEEFKKLAMKYINKRRR